MVKHGTNKKRRRNLKTTRKPQKHHKLRVANKVPEGIKKEWDASKSPSENLQAFGLEADPNQTLSGMRGVGRKHVKPTDGTASHSAAFLGMTIVPRDGRDAMKEANPKLKILAEVDQKYASLLIAAHGDNYSKMAKDIKVNYNQLTLNKCQKLCEKFLALPKADLLV